jgi:poly(3-hydroxybutyrate) depolymerase
MMNGRDIALQRAVTKQAPRRSISMKSGRLLMILGSLSVVASGCSGHEGQSSTGSGGSTGTAGSLAQGGATAGASAGGSGGTTSMTGTGGTMGIPTTGGTPSVGGQPGSGGQPGTGAGGTPGTAGQGGPNTGGSAGTPGSGGSGAAGTAGMSGSAGSAGAGGAIPFKNPAAPSAGCGKPTTLTTGKKTITSTGQERTYIIDLPTNYDVNKPYRLFYTSHWIGSTSEAVRDQNYYFLKPLANAANEPAIFVAPQSDGQTWQQKDHALFDDILAYVKQNLCIDTTRVFATGFSFGGMITYSLSVNHQKDIRAAVGIAPANYNIYVPTKTHQPIAWMQTTGMGDNTCPWVNGSSTTQGAKYIAIERGTDNGCTVPATIPIWQQGSHVCYDFQGCKTEFPTKVCTFNGGHTNIASDPGSNANWIPQESWKFFTQF